MRTEKVNQAALAEFFSARVVRQMAREGSSGIFSRLVDQSGIADVIDHSRPISDVFEFALEHSKRPSCRHEYIYKAAIVEKVLLGAHSLRTASMLTEFRANNCKADVVILNGTATAYEIKSERDNLEKLERQVDAYRSIFASVNVIAASSHVDEIVKVVPNDVGIQVLTSRFQISTLRRAINDPRRVLPGCIFESLPLAESKAIAVFLGLKIPDVPNTQIFTALKRDFSKLDPAAVHSAMVRVLRKSRSQIGMSWFIKNMPKSLHTAALTTSLRKSDQVALLGAMNVKIAEALTWS
jgi:hypothetical protein